MDKNQGYEIIKAVMLENGRGFALGHPPQHNFTRKAAVCLHAFIPICADATRPNG